jgi:hypothetical protein
MTVARRIGPKPQTARCTAATRSGACESLDTMLASIVAIQTGSLGRLEIGAAMIAATVERLVMAESDRAALLAALNAHVADVRVEKERLAGLQEVTFVFPGDDELLVLPTAA